MMNRRTFIGQVAARLASADPSQKAALYEALAVHLVYRPDAAVVEAP